MTETRDVASSEKLTFKRKNRKQFRKRNDSSEESSHSEEEEDDNGVRYTNSVTQ